MQVMTANLFLNVYFSIMGKTTQQHKNELIYITCSKVTMIVASLLFINQLISWLKKGKPAVSWFRGFMLAKLTCYWP